MYLNRRLRHLTRVHSTALAAMLMVAACDSSTADLVKEIDAAREGCTEEMLAAGAEECVQMFEKYVDMGSEAIGTYIGAMRALDEALQRRPGLQFDTAGLGHAISPGIASPDSTVVRPWSLEPRMDQEGSVYRSNPSWEPDSPSWDGSADAYAPSGRAGGPPGPRPWPELDSEPRRQAPTEVDQLPGRPDYREFDERRRSPAPDPGQRATPPRRGSLLPPEERLRRPWIGDEEPPTQYYPDGAAPRTDDRPREITPDVGPRREPYEDPPRYPF